MLKVNVLLIYLKEVFKDKNYTNYQKLLDTIKLEDLESLGFNDESRDKFITLYGKASNNVEELERIIDSIKDPYLLANAIYSRFKYFKNTSTTPEVLLNDNNRQWFLMALNRLSVLVEIFGFDTEKEDPNVTEEEVDTLFYDLMKLRFDIAIATLKERGYIEAKYIMEFGNINCQIVEFTNILEIYKRELELIEEGIAKNDLRINEINSVIEKEFHDKKLKLNEMIKMQKMTVDRYMSIRNLEVEGYKELNRYYLKLKRAEYQLGKQASNEERKIFLDINRCFEQNELEKMIEYDSKIDYSKAKETFDKLSLGSKKKKILNSISEYKGYLERIQGIYPYVLRVHIRDEEDIQKKKNELEENISKLKEIINLYKDRIQKLLNEHRKEE